MIFLIAFYVKDKAKKSYFVIDEYFDCIYTLKKNPLGNCF